MSILQYLERVTDVGDVFNGRLLKHVEKVSDNRVDRSFSIIDIPTGGWHFDVRTGMGFRDLCCLNFDELQHGNRYTFEVINMNSDRKVVYCRALARTDNGEMGYQYGDEACDVRKVNQYERGKNVVVIPGKIKIDTDRETPPAIFYDPDYPELTGFIFFDKSEHVKPLIGRRVRVMVDNSPLKTGKSNIYTRFLKQERDKWLG